MDISDRSDCSDDGSTYILDDDLLEDDEIDDDADIRGPIPILHKSGHQEVALHELDGKVTSRLKQKSGSLHGKRSKGTSTRPNETHWGNASTPIISMKDLMGGELNATKVGMTNSAHLRPKRSSDPHDGAQTKKKNIIKRKMARKDRRNDVKNSLAHFLQASEEQPNAAPECEDEAEDESLISEEGEAGKLDNNNLPSSEHDDDDEKSDDDKSVKSHSRRRHRNPRRTVSDEGALKGSSHHSRKRPPRRRIKSVDVVGDDASVVSRKSHRGNRRTTAVRDVPDVPDDGTVGSRRRRAPHEEYSKPVVDGGTSSTPRRRRDHGKAEDGDEKLVSPQHSRRNKSPTADDADDRSVGSRKSVGRRRRGHTGGKGRPPRQRSPAPPSKDGDGNRTAPVTPQPAEKDELNEIEKRMASLSNHLQSNPECGDKRDPEEESEESSRFSFGYQPTLLQFDPTNANHFTSVNQEEGHLTSGTIRHADGTESELQIRELSNLPTFEAPQPDFHDSQASFFSDGDGPETSNMSDHGDGEAPKSTKSMGGEAKSTNRARGVTGTRSFLQRIRKKKEKDDSDDEEQPQSSQSMFARKKRAPKELTHQALDDYGSDQG